MDFSYMLTATSDSAIDFAILLIRLFIGPCFIVHALGKLGVVGTGNMDGFASWLEDLGVPFAGVQARMAMLSELVGGALLTVGLLTRPACLVLVGTMVVAGKLGHRGAGYLITNDPPGAEYTINLAAIAFAVFVTGPGSISLDALLF
jgi:putative oxidoreductase